MASETSNVPVACGVCGGVAAPWRAVFPWGPVLVLGAVTGVIGGLALAQYHLQYGDAVCGNCGRTGPFREPHVGAQVVASRRVVRAGHVAVVVAVVTVAVLFSASALDAMATEQDAAGYSDPSWVYAFLFSWVGVPLLAVVAGASKRSKRVKQIAAIQQAAHGLAPPLAATAAAPREERVAPAPTPSPLHSPSPSPSPDAPASDLRGRVEALAASHPNLAELPRLRELAAAGDAAALSLRVGEVDARLAEREKVLRLTQDSARKLARLSERLADGELSESAYQSAKAHLEREGASLEERLRSLDGELFREDFEKPI